MLNTSKSKEQLIEELAQLHRLHAEREKVLDQRERLLNRSHQISQIILSSLDSNLIIEGLAEQIILGGIFRSLMIALVDQEAQRVRVVGRFMNDELIRFGEDFVAGKMTTHTDVAGLEYALDDDNITAVTARTGVMQIIEEWDNRLDSRVDTPENRRGKVSYFVPIKQGDRVLAVLATGSEMEDKGAMLQQIKTMEPLWGQVAIALEHAQLYESLQQQVAERKHMEEELRRVRNLESLGVLAGGIAHDFNNVLTGVMGSLALLERLGDEGSQVQIIAREGREAADRTRHLTQQLLTFAKGGAPARKRTSLDELLREASELALRGSNSRVRYHLAEDLSTADIDRGQIAQVVENLVLNADQAMPDGGTVEIAAKNVDITAQDVLPLKSGAYVKVSVRDEGGGILSGPLEKIFDPYFTTKKAGHGLGLSIVYSIVQRHDGCIQVHSEVGVGTIFDFFLPALREVKGQAGTEGQTLALRQRVGVGSEVV